MLWQGHPLCIEQVIDQGYRCKRQEDEQRTGILLDGTAKAFFPVLGRRRNPQAGLQYLEQEGIEWREIPHADDEVQQVHVVGAFLEHAGIDQKLIQQRPRDCRLEQVSLVVHWVFPHLGSALCLVLRSFSHFPTGFLMAKDVGGMSGIYLPCYLAGESGSSAERVGYPARGLLARVPTNASGVRRAQPGLAATTRCLATRTSACKDE